MNHNKPHPWECRGWRWGQGSCGADELWHHPGPAGPCCALGFTLSRFSTAWPVLPPTGSNFTLSNEAWKWASPELARKLTCPGGRRTTPKASLDLCPKVKLLIKHVLCFFSQTHTPEINMSSPSPGPLPEGRQTMYTYVPSNYIWFFLTKLISVALHIFL